MKPGTKLLLKIQWKEREDGTAFVKMRYNDQEMSAEKILNYLKKYTESIERQIEDGEF